MSESRSIYKERLTLEVDFRNATSSPGYAEKNIWPLFTYKNIWPRKEVINRERQFYIDNDFQGESSQVFKLGSTGLSITAMKTPHHLREHCRGLNKVDIKSYSDAVTEQESSRAFQLPYISGLLSTRKKFDQLYGYFEISAILPKARGAWPAFWLLPTHERWPDGVAVLPEIDIMEAVRDVAEGVYHATAHSNVSGKSEPISSQAVSTGKMLRSKAHRFGLSWEPDYLIWYFDGQEVSRCETPADMHTPMHCLINLAVGGWGGEPVEKDYPAEFVIEWLRVFSSSSKPIDLPDPEPEPVPSDVVYWLDNGKPVTLSQINHVTEYLIQSSHDMSSKRK